MLDRDTVVDYIPRAYKDRVRLINLLHEAAPDYVARNELLRRFFDTESPTKAQRHRLSATISATRKYLLDMNAEFGIVTENGTVRLTTTPQRDIQRQKYGKMSPTAFMLTERHDKMLSNMSKAREVSMAQVVRDLIEERYEEDSDSDLRPGTTAGDSGTVP